MKIILSRKGFDSGAGGIPSARLGKKLISFPIPNKNDIKDDYNNLQFYDEIYRKSNVKYSEIITDLYKKHNNNPRTKIGLELCEHCHVDPDLNYDTRINKMVEKESWKPIFGQSSTSGGYLLYPSEDMINGDLTIEEGDLFLFFGNYREVVFDKNYKFKRGSKIEQVIWGWMFVDEIISQDEITKENWKDKTKEYYWHPHHYDENTKHDHNVLVVGCMKEKQIGNCIVPGYGIFDYASNRVLSKSTPANWKFEDSYNLPNIKYRDRKNSSKNPSDTILYAGEWQEIIMKYDEEWLRKIFALENNE